VTLPFEDFAELVRARRSNLVMDHERAVPTELIDQLCELATWAPNHKRTWPWRFAVAIGDGRARLGEAFVADLVAADLGDAGKRAKTRTKYLRAPAVLVVAARPHDHPSFHEENRDAVAAGIQNLLLGATAAGLASFWSTPPVADGAAVRELCGFDPGDRIVGVVYLGWPNGDVERPQRPSPDVRHITA
jgi:nitroreductase